MSIQHELMVAIRAALESGMAADEITDIARMIEQEMESDKADDLEEPDTG